MVISTFVVKFVISKQKFHSSGPFGKVVFRYLLQAFFSDKQNLFFSMTHLKVPDQLLQ